MITPQFLNIADKSVKLEDLNPGGETEPDYTVNLQTLSDSGATTGMYEWNGAEWETLKGVDASEVELKAGEGIWVQAEDTTQWIQSSGKINLAVVKVQLRNGGRMAGNPNATDIYLNELAVEGENTAYEVNVQILSDSGATIGMYEWNGTTWEYLKGKEPDISKVKFVPGEGVWVQGSDTNQYLVFPGTEITE